ncbi:hypothetical protein MEO41_28005, partial [Dolichospermum sp. ST_sed4]|nr:hypothetical protein [Dolichospermum sp. ST_sed4]
MNGTTIATRRKLSIASSSTSLGAYSLWDSPPVIGNITPNSGRFTLTNITATSPELKILNSQGYYTRITRSATGKTLSAYTSTAAFTNTSNTQLLLHMNTDFSDFSAQNHFPIAGYTATVYPGVGSSGATKFGSGTGKFVRASSQNISYANSTDWAFGSVNFTVD